MLLAFLFFIFSMPVWEEDHGPTNWAWLINQIARKIRDLHIHHADTYWLACRTNKKHLSFQLLVPFHQSWGWKAASQFACWWTRQLLVMSGFTYFDIFRVPKRGFFHTLPKKYCSEAWCHITHDFILLPGKFSTSRDPLRSNGARFTRLWRGIFFQNLESWMCLVLRNVVGRMGHVLKKSGATTV